MYVFNRIYTKLIIRLNYFLSEFYFEVFHSFFYPLFSSSMINSDLYYLQYRNCITLHHNYSSYCTVVRLYVIFFSTFISDYSFSLYYVNGITNV